jgi:hypothetical protein
LACSSPARTAHDPPNFLRKRIVTSRPPREIDPGEIVNKLAVQRQSRPLLPELSELFASFPTFAGLRPLFDSRAVRLEDEMKDGIYIVVDEDEDHPEQPQLEDGEDEEQQQSVG